MYNDKQVWYTVKSATNASEEHMKAQEIQQFVAQEPGHKNSRPETEDLMKQLDDHVQWLNSEQGT
ncbi:MAG TPA: hypothetical protein VGP13_01460, partial [Candidatus Paceibacterota bacterium]|nr:hypothetical protein [Candidatus Paceibacterota bacterium]